MALDKRLSLTFRVVISVILLQSLYFKFTGQPVSKELFGILGVEPWGRIGLGVVEFITGILLLIPDARFHKLGVSFALVIGIGAVLTHILFIGIIFDGDFVLFSLAVVITLLSGMLLWKNYSMSLLRPSLKK